MPYDSIYDSITPQDLGLPPKFASLRTGQRSGLEWFDRSLAPVLAACMPTGFGKTAWAVGCARLSGVKSVYLVVTKALQKQVLDDFESCGMVDIRGRANYDCPNYGNCEEGYKEDCALSKTTSCPYVGQVEAAKNSDLLVTNYAYWLYARKYNARALEWDERPVELLICDEAHNLEQQLSGFASVKIYAAEFGREWSGAFDQSGQMQPIIGGAYGEEAAVAKGWFAFARFKMAKFEDRYDLTDDEKDLLDRLKRILRMTPNWVWQFDERGHVTFEPVRVTAYAKALFSGVPRVLLMSASLNRFVCDLVLPSDMAYEYRSWPSVFPTANAPVYHIPTRKLSWKSTDDDYKAILQATDAIVDSRQDRKGIVHTVSYARTRRALQHSRNVGRFIWNERSIELAGCLDRFRAAGPGAVLITPSVEEGFDFPLEQCEYQILLKFPFPNETQRVIKERCTQIPGYRLNYAAQKVMQIRGRPIRSEEDRSELFILDNACKQLTGPEGKNFCAPGFRIFTVTQVPPAPPKINRQ